MSAIERAALENQIIIMRTLGADCRNGYLRDELREHVRRSVGVLEDFDRDTRIRRAGAARTHKQVYQTSKATGKRK